MLKVNAASIFNLSKNFISFVRLDDISFLVPLSKRERKDKTDFYSCK